MSELWEWMGSLLQKAWEQEASVFSSEFKFVSKWWSRKTCIAQRNWTRLLETLLRLCNEKITRKGCSGDRNMSFWIQPLGTEKQADPECPVSPSLACGCFLGYGAQEGWPSPAVAWSWLWGLCGAELWWNGLVIWAKVLVIWAKCCNFWNIFCCGCMLAMSWGAFESLDGGQKWGQLTCVDLGTAKSVVHLCIWVA